MAHFLHYAIYCTCPPPGAPNQQSGASTAGTHLAWFLRKINSQVSACYTKHPHTYAITMHSTSVLFLTRFVRNTDVWLAKLRPLCSIRSLEAVATENWTLEYCSTICVTATNMPWIDHSSVPVQSGDYSEHKSSNNAASSMHSKEQAPLIRGKTHLEDLALHNELHGATFMAACKVGRVACARTTNRTMLKITY